jgi:hypothetical protein
MSTLTKKTVLSFRTEKTRLSDTDQQANSTLICCKSSQGDGTGIEAFLSIPHLVRSEGDTIRTFCPLKKLWPSNEKVIYPIGK